MVKRLGWVLAELPAVLAGKAPKLVQSETERDFSSQVIEEVKKSTQKQS
jgi:hypothetical protein